MLCCDIRTEMVDHEICLLSLAVRHIGQVDNTTEDRNGSWGRSVSHRGLSIMH